MDTTLVIIVALVACIVVGALLVFRYRMDLSLSLPGKIKFGMKAKNKTPAVIAAEDIEAKKGDIEATNEAGGDIRAKKLRAGRHVTLTTTSSEKDKLPK